MSRYKDNPTNNKQGTKRYKRYGYFANLNFSTFNIII